MFVTVYYVLINACTELSLFALPTFPRGLNYIYVALAAYAQEVVCLHIVMFLHMYLHIFFEDISPSRNILLGVGILTW